VRLQTNLDFGKEELRLLRATVTVRRDGGRVQIFRIVGEDEAEPARGTISYVSPLARAVLGGRVGDAVEVPGGNATITQIK
jgi:transcription elongation GreA/GreB family factor